MYFIIFYICICIILTSWCITGGPAGGHPDGGHCASHQAEQVQEANQVRDAVIGQDWSRNLNSGLWLVNTIHVTLILTSDWSTQLMWPLISHQRGILWCFLPDTGRVRSQRTWCVPAMMRGFWMLVRVKYSYFTTRRLYQKITVNWLCEHLASIACDCRR